MFSGKKGGGYPPQYNVPSQAPSGLKAYTPERQPDIQAQREARGPKPLRYVPEFLQNSGNPLYDRPSFSPEEQAEKERLRLQTNVTLKASAKSIHDYDAAVFSLFSLDGQSQNIPGDNTFQLVGTYPLIYDPETNTYRPQNESDFAETPIIIPTSEQSPVEGTVGAFALFDGAGTETQVPEDTPALITGNIPLVYNALSNSFEVDTSTPSGGGGADPQTGWQTSDVVTNGATAASATQAAPGAGNVNVIRSIYARLAGPDNSLGGTTVTVVSGVTTLFEAVIFKSPDDPSDEINISGIYLTGGDNEAVTISFSQQTGTDIVAQSVAMSGFVTATP